MRVQVLGAGAWGLSAALALAHRGHDVAVHDPRGIGTGATSKAAGILSTMVSDDRDASLVLETRGALERLQQNAGLRVLHRRSSLVIAGPMQTRHLADLTGRADRLGVKHRNTVTPDEHERLLIADNEHVLCADGDAVIEAGDLVQLLDSQVRKACAKVQQRHTSPDAVVVAAGAWTPSVLSGWGVQLPLIPYRTQLASLRMPHAEQLPIVHDLRQGFYLRPGGHGEVLAGDGTQLRRFDPEDYNEAGEPEFLASIAERVVQRIRGGEGATIASSWAGLCVGTPDRRPIVGAVPDKDGLFVMSGDNGFGVMRCLALGERLADCVEGNHHDDLSVERFGSSPPKEFALREGFAP